MSLINDALRRASQSDKNRPSRQATPIGMQPAPVAQSSRVTAILIGTVVVTMTLAGWLFWQLFSARHNHAEASHDASLFPPVELRVGPPPAAQPKLAPVAAVAPVAPAKPVAAPEKPAVAPTPAVVAAPAPSPVAPAVAPAAPAHPTIAWSIAPTAAPPVATKDPPVVWPSDIKLTAIFYSRKNPRILVNGNMYGIGDQIEGVIIRQIENNQVTLESNGHYKVLFLEGQ